MKPDAVFILSRSIQSSTEQVIGSVLDILPMLFASLGVLLVGVFLGMFTEWLFIKFGEKARLSRLWRRLEFDVLLQKANIKSNPSRLVGVFLKGVIITLFLRQSAKMMGFYEVEEFLNKIILLAPNIVIAMLIVIFAVQMGNTASSLTKNFLHVGDKNARNIVAAFVQNIIFAFGILAALFQVGIAPELVQTLFTALVSMIALAGGLAFGLGGKDFVREMLEEMRKKGK
ncbi:hypothetical protein IPN35_03390 [Candidatus Peregrinibacteria bacterium]|nr:MAG: hypothetical protein IPN35_03390 [Candidatus Peregrinibacteria bacterium]